MQKLVREYLDELNRRQKKGRKIAVAVMLLVVIVVGTVAGVLTQHGVAMTGTPKCGLKEHTHDEDCYTKELTCGLEEGEGHAHSDECLYPAELTCGLEEGEGHKHSEECQSPAELTCGLEESEGDDEEEGHTHTEECYTVPEGFICGLEEAEGHTHVEACYTVPEGYSCGLEEGEGHKHTDECYTEELTCEETEHTHTDICYTDAAADVEDPAVWEGQYAEVEWKGIWNEDLVTAAQMQLEYRESVENYIVTEDGAHKGYTRYGQFAGDFYVDWEAAFVNFCMHYAGMKELDPAVFPDETDTAKWCEEFEKVREGNAEYLIGPEGYVPVVGDVVFFQRENEETACQMGIVSLVDEENGVFSAIEGNNQNEVRENTYQIGAEYVVRYLKVSELEAAYKNADGTDNVEEAMIELTTEVDGTTITLSGPESSFEAGKEYSIQAEKVESEVIAAAVEEAVANMVEEAAAEETDSDAEAEEPETESEEAVAATDEAEAVPEGTDTVEASGEPTAAEVSEETTAAPEEQTAADEETKDQAPVPEETSEEPAEAAKENENQESEIKSYQAFDIKLIADGEEVQPIGPVSVKFSGQEVAESVEDEETRIKVLHVDEATGEATDMEAVTTEDSDVVIETEHFSVYVYVNLTDIFGKIKITVQHWGENITTIDGKAEATNSKEDGDTVFDESAVEVKTRKSKCEIYSTDTLEIPNEYYADVTKLSKVCNVHDGMNYTVSKIWVSNLDKIAGKIEQEQWTAGTYVEYAIDGKQEITLTENSLIRFWYTPKKDDDQLETQAIFYDYDISDGQVYENVSARVNTTSGLNLREAPVSGNRIITMPNKAQVVLLSGPDDLNWYKVTYKDGKETYEGYASGDFLTIYSYLKTEAYGINSDSNYDTPNATNKLGIGQQASGNLSSWTTTSRGGTYNELLNGFNSDKTYHRNTVVKGIVADELKDGKPQFTVAAPRNLFGTESSEKVSSGSKPYDYQIKFKQDGDTYTLQHVYDGSSCLTEDLTTFHKYEEYVEDPVVGNKKFSAPVYSNDFWPMDKVDKNIDPLIGQRQFQYTFLFNDGKSLNFNNIESENPTKTDAPNASDDSKQHNWHFGMEFTLEFTVGDYTGPMEYYFRGDDDFWLFIDGELAVDIGGIHSSVGQSLDIKDWLEKRGQLAEDKKNDLHTLKVFYMERGGFGSCCYMQFTIPNSEPVTVPVPQTTEYEVEKVWDDNGNPFRPGSITVELQQINEADKSVKNTNKTVTLSAPEWKHKWTGLPKINGSSKGEYSYSYQVREINLPKGYTAELKNGVLTNTLERVKVEVQKKWENDTGLEGYRPDVKIKLFADGEEYKGSNNEVILNDANHWSGEFINLPKYRYDKGDSMGTEITYSVKEVGINGETVDVGGYIDGKEGAKYQVSEITPQTGTITTGTTNQPCVASFEVTNTLCTSFQIVKKSRLGEKALEGAKFTLASCNENEEAGETKYVGISQNDGVMKWQEGQTWNENAEEEKIISFIPQGKYLLKEIESPVGYQLSTEEWIITVNEEGRATIKTKESDGSNESEVKSSSETSVVDGTVVFTFTFNNEIIYQLPSTGGVGIYWYSIGGILLMMAGALILYKNKCKEVLGG